MAAVRRDAGGGPRLSVCLIVKNEEAHLARCLESVRGLAAEIIVVDTGSSDRTIEIARSVGARTSRIEWQDDFSRARNACLDLATGEWILSIDADETLAPRDHDAVRRLIGRTDADVFVAVQRNYLASDTVVGWTPGTGGYDEGAPYVGYVDVECRRLFRNRRWLRFHHPVHEVISSTDPARVPREARGAFVLHHFGKIDPAVVHAKGEAYLRIGLAKAAASPRDPLAAYEVGVQHVELGRPAEALPWFERTLTIAPAFRDAALMVAVCLARTGQHRRALDALQTAARTLPDRAAEISFEEGNALRELGDRAGAEAAFARTLAMRPTLAAASVNLALLRLAADRRSDALAVLDRALEHSPRHVEARLLRARIRRESGDADGALQDLDQLGTPAALQLRARLLVERRRFQDARACLTQLAADDPGTTALRGIVALGLGDLPEAIAQLRRSLQQGPSYEVARNLATALRASGDRQGAIDVAAEAVALTDDSHAMTWFGQLAGDALSRRAAGRDDPELIVFVCAAAAHVVSAVVDVAPRAGARVVVFTDQAERPGAGNIEHAPVPTLARRCVRDRPDVVIADSTLPALATARLAPLQIAWLPDSPSAEGSPATGSGIDFFLASDAGAESPGTEPGAMAAWRILALGRDWELIRLAATAAPSPLVERIAVHLAAGRAPLALKMTEKDSEAISAPADARQALEALVRWCAGSGAIPGAAALRLALAQFPELRRPGILDRPAA